MYVPVANVTLTLFESVKPFSNQNVPPGVNCTVAPLVNVAPGSVT
jgi:hypothetical protein